MDQGCMWTMGVDTVWTIDVVWTLSVVCRHMRAVAKFHGCTPSVQTTVFLCDSKNKYIKGS